ncbi:MAG: hypothetical protein ACXVII_32355 [Solirubrobacteraceae bacterium]
MSQPAPRIIRLPTVGDVTAEPDFDDTMLYLLQATLDDRRREDLA